MQINQDEPVNTEEKQKGRPFSKGVSGNPAGCPPGRKRDLPERHVRQILEALAERLDLAI